MTMKEDFIEIDLDQNEQSNVVRDILDVHADYDDLHPVSFAVALVDALQITCERSGVSMHDILHHVTTDYDEELH
jgi:hypothetical protein